MTRSQQDRQFLIAGIVVIASLVIAMAIVLINA
jgi:hypothetical protein